MNERIKHFYFWISLITLGVVVCLLSLLKVADFRRGEDISLMESAFSRVKTILQSQNTLLTYQSKNKALSFQYPKKLTLTEKLNKVELSHQILYKNNGDCNMKGDDVVYNYLTDFRALFEIFNGTVKQAALKYSSYMPVENFKGDTLKINSGFIDEYKIGNLSGFSIYEGVEGCGHVIYYFPIDNNRTLIVEKAMIQALSSVIVKEERDKVLKVPGVITPEENEQIFKQILGSLRISPPQDMGRDGGEVDLTDWKTYRNEEYGFEFKYPASDKQMGEKWQSNLGTYDNPVFGIAGGGGVFVVLDRPDLKLEAKSIIERVEEVARKPVYNPGGPSVECEIRKINNPDVGVRAGYCTGEGGPAYYALLTGNGYNVFFDGYPARSIDLTALEKILSTFKFIK